MSSPNVKISNQQILTQLEAAASIVPTLNFYQLLKLSPLASTEEIRAAFHKEAYNFHPDRYQGRNDESILKLSRQIYGRIVEAYQTLSNTVKREAYDAGLGTNPSEAGVVTAIQPKATSNSAQVVVRFMKLAQVALQSADLQSAKLNIQLALNSSPNDAKALQLSLRIDSALQSKRRSE